MSDEPRNIDLTVSLEQDAHHIRGCVTDVDGGIHAFSGWLELMSVIDVARDGSGSAREPGG